MIPPLALVQARYASTRLPGKLCLPLGGKPLVAWAWGAAVEAFGAEHVVVAIPAGDAPGPLGAVLGALGARVFAWDGAEADVLGRFWRCAHTYRWRPESVLVRVTPDDPFKEPALLRRVAEGERVPVEQGGEAFTLAMLDAAHVREERPERREHLTLTLFDVAPPPAPPGIWTVDTPGDYEAVQRRVGDRPKRGRPRNAEAPAVRRGVTGDLSDPQMGELVSPFDGGPWRPC